jgi:hypothetical protein
MAYCTPDDLKELGYTWDDTADLAYITAICETASQTVDTYCKQSFTAKTSYNDTGLVRVKCGMFKYFPKKLTITNIESVSFLPIAGYQVPFEITYPSFMNDKGYIMAFTLAPDGQYYVKATYDFGFAVGSFPTDLVKATMLACAPLLDDYFLSQDSNVSMVKSIKQGELTIVREDTHSMPQNALNILNGGNDGLGYVRVRATS